MTSDAFIPWWTSGISCWTCWALAWCPRKRLFSGVVGARHMAVSCWEKVAVMHLLWWKCWLIKCWDHVHHQWFEINRLWNWCCFFNKKKKYSGLLLHDLNCLAADGVALLICKDVVAVLKNINMLCFPHCSSSCCHFNLGMSKLCFALALRSGSPHQYRVWCLGLLCHLQMWNKSPMWAITLLKWDSCTEMR